SPNIPVCAVANAGGFIRWYANQSNPVPCLSNSLCYTSPYSLTGTYTYWASQIIDGCESERSPVDYKVKALPPTPTISGINVICEYESNPTFTATGIGETMRWFTDAGIW